MQVLLGHPFGDMTTQALISEAIAEVMFELRRRANNNNEIDGSGIPDFRRLLIGDYLDGIDLSGVSAAPGGTAPQAWNDTYKNNRLILSGFNTYKGTGDTDITKNHILFTFRNIICQGYINPTNTNVGGYPATEMRAWLEGADGDGSGPLATKLKAALGGNYLLTMHLVHSIKGNTALNDFTVFLPTEIEIFGYQGFGDELVEWNTNIQFPIYAKSTIFRVKRYNGVKTSWWQSTPIAAAPGNFALVGNFGFLGAVNATNLHGISPAFCAM
jgi:hypothetical protein